MVRNIPNLSHETSVNPIQDVLLVINAQV